MLHAVVNTLIHAVLVNVLEDGATDLLNDLEP